MYRILFVDEVTGRSYDGNTLETKPQGGTESTVTRIAEGLVRRGHRVCMAQRGRADRAIVNGVEVTPFTDIGDFVPTHVVCVWSARRLDEISERWPRARGFLYYQDVPVAAEPFVTDTEALIGNNGTAILVSAWQREQWINCMRAFGYAGDENRVVYIYNAIPDDLQPDATPVDPDKFIYFSIPDKGLRETLDLFSRFPHYPQLRDVRLYVASPGYREMGFELPTDRVVYLGKLPWPDVIQEVRSSFMVLDCNVRRPETFGLVHAEADAVGTPWIGGYLGANKEVRDHPDELMDLSDPDTVIQRIIDWKENGRLQVRGREEFRLSNVLDEWEKLLAEEWEGPNPERSVVHP